MLQITPWTIEPEEGFSETASLTGQEEEADAFEEPAVLLPLQEHFELH
jgi:hypothetical protein